MSNDIIANAKIFQENLTATKRCMKIAHSGTHGTGKTTRVFEKAKELKIKFPKKTIGNFIGECNPLFITHQQRNYYAITVMDFLRSDEE